MSSCEVPEGCGPARSPTAPAEEVEGDVCAFSLGGLLGVGGACAPPVLSPLTPTPILDPGSEILCLVDSGLPSVEPLGVCTRPFQDEFCRPLDVFCPFPAYDQAFRAAFCVRGELRRPTMCRPLGESLLSVSLERKVN